MAVASLGDRLRDLVRTFALADRLRGPARTFAAALLLAGVPFAAGSATVLIVAGSATVLIVAESATAAEAEPKPTVKQLKKELAELQKESDKLITDYYNSRIAQQKAEKAEKSAREKLAAAQEVYDRESTELRAMAVAQYTGGEPNQLAMLTGRQDPSALLSGMALTQHLVAVQDARLRGYAQVRNAHQQAKDESAARAKELAETAGDLEGRKKKAEKQIERIKDKIDQLYQAPGVRRSDGTWVPQLPEGADNITPRMRLVKMLIQERFGVPYGIGCYRAIQDGGEHPLGRACDFMLSRGGALPAGAELERGEEIANWAIKNARRLGIMYIIYRQRIWHVGTGAWRTMSDRGGTTANHYDHPHISVY
ncbi:coiled-coil domain-containing protein [Nonomuraea sp. M3C6]|uniref:Coiled-coil domain-containing protein n=1 Tax=Nonomuraea marmarensis TaxID=3351344 RepID=A0ABW7AHM5_9ACTN